MEDRHIVLIICPDEKGLVHKLTGALFKRDLNVIENDETVDRTSNTFFMRTEFLGNFDHDELLSEIKSFLPKNALLSLRPLKTKKIVLFATREPHCLGDLLLRHSSKELDAKVEAVISQYEDLRDLVERFSIPFHFVPVENRAKKDSRENHEKKLLKIVDSYDPEFLVLAKYMRILSPSFVARFPHRILNIHHSFLPAFVGANPYVQAYERGVKIIGATAHFVTKDLDDGPIITQSVVSIGHADSAQKMSKAGRDVEKLVLARALSLVLEDRVLVHGRRTVVFA